MVGRIWMAAESKKNPRSKSARGPVARNQSMGKKAVKAAATTAARKVQGRSTAVTRVTATSKSAGKAKSARPVPAVARVKAKGAASAKAAAKKPVAKAKAQGTKKPVDSPALRLKAQRDKEQAKKLAERDKAKLKAQQEKERQQAQREKELARKQAEREKEQARKLAEREKAQAKAAQEKERLRLQREKDQAKKQVEREKARALAEAEREKAKQRAEQAAQRQREADEKRRQIEDKRNREKAEKDRAEQEKRQAREREAEARRLEVERQRQEREQKRLDEIAKKQAERDNARLAKEEEAARLKAQRESEKEAQRLAKEEEKARLKAEREAEKQRLREERDAERERQREEARRQREEARAQREAEQAAFRKAKEAEQTKIRAEREAARRALEGRVAKASGRSSRGGARATTTTRVYSPASIPDQSRTRRGVSSEEALRLTGIRPTPHPPAEPLLRPRTVPPPPPPPPPIEPPASVEERYALVQERLRTSSDEFRQEYEENFLMSWIHHDSALEGVVYTYEELRTAVNPNITVVPDSSLQSVCEEIRRHKAAIEFVRDYGERKRAPVTLDHLKRIYLILHPEEGDLKTVRYRKDVPQHRMYFHEYTAPDKIPYKVRQIFDWLNGPEPKKLKSALRIAAKVHYDLLRVFPFAKDSGKVVRLFTNMLLLRADYPPAILHSTERQRYYEALKGAPTVLYSMLHAAIMNALQSIEKKQDERESRMRAITT
jgi:hypothetical protein